MYIEKEQGNAAGTNVIDPNQLRLYIKAWVCKHAPATSFYYKDPPAATHFPSQDKLADTSTKMAIITAIVFLFALNFVANYDVQVFAYNATSHTESADRTLRTGWSRLSS